MDNSNAMPNAKIQSSNGKTILTFDHFDIDLTLEL
jgi:hypothetical protein